MKILCGFLAISICVAILYCIGVGYELFSKDKLSHSDRFLSGLLITIIFIGGILFCDVVGTIILKYFGYV